VFRRDVAGVAVREQVPPAVRHVDVKVHRGVVDEVDL
jgi:hypothetical protein